MRWRFERTGLVVHGELSDEDIRALVRQLGRMQNAVRWWLGDVLCLVKNHWPKDGKPSFGEWDDVLADLGLEPATASSPEVAVPLLCVRRPSTFRPSWPDAGRLRRLLGGAPSKPAQ